MKNILVPCDFSQPAIDAFRFALDVARQSKGSVHLLNIIELPVIQDPIIMPVVIYEQDFLKGIKEKIQNEFKKIMIKYNTEGVNVTSIVEFGPTRMITDFVKKYAIDAIIMGSHGAGGFREYFVGSNAEKVVRNASVPVFVIKDYIKAPIQNIVFANALGEENQEDLIMRVKALQDFFKAKVHIVFINTPANFISDSVALNRLDEIAKRFMFKNFTVNIYNHQNEEDGILHFTRKIDGDLIAMGTHGRKGISHLLNGSLAEDVVNHTDCPIWTYKVKSLASLSLEVEKEEEIVGFPLAAM